LAQCIESVLAQSYTNFEYILLDNCSTDGSSEIAERYSGRDSRIRFIRRSDFVSQIENFNRALTEISEASLYCKLVLADDYIFPEQLRLMVQAFERSESIGLVSSYCLMGNTVMGSGYPYPTPVLSGREVARRHLLSGAYGDGGFKQPFVFGSPTTVMYRSSVVRHQRPFYNESSLHADTEKCMEILARWDFGFVHQVLSFLRNDNESISSTRRGFDREAAILDWYIIVRRYSLVFLEASEGAALGKKAKRSYYRCLAASAVRFRKQAFWRYHKVGLKTVDETVDWPYLALQIVVVLFWIGSNLGRTMLDAVRSWKRRWQFRSWAP
jgi:glycosyltransferase involved in cell wall biosynthesis